MTDLTTGALPGLLAALALGAMAGGLYCAALWRATRQVVARGAVGPLLAGMALRLALVAGALAGAAALGATAGQLLAAAVGFGLARHVATRRLGEAR